MPICRGCGQSVALYDLPDEHVASADRPLCPGCRLRVRSASTSLPVDPVLESERHTKREARQRRLARMAPLGGFVNQLLDKAVQDGLSPDGTRAQAALCTECAGLVDKFGTTGREERDWVLRLIGRREGICAVCGGAAAFDATASVEAGPGAARRRTLRRELLDHLFRACRAIGPAVSPESPEVEWVCVRCANEFPLNGTGAGKLYRWHLHFRTMPSAGSCRVCSDQGTVVLVSMEIVSPPKE